MNEFSKDLLYEASNIECFKKAYHSFFDNIISIEFCKDLDRQRAGIDAIVRLKNGNSIFVQNKLRRKSWSDILLEVVSNSKSSTPGYIEKNYDIDYLAYCFEETGKVYFFPWDLLRRSYLRHKEEWREKYGTIMAQNSTLGGYHSVSIPVPIDILLKALTEETMVIIKGTK